MNDLSIQTDSIANYIVNHITLITVSDTFFHDTQRYNYSANVHHSNLCIHYHQIQPYSLTQQPWPF